MKALVGTIFLLAFSAHDGIAATKDPHPTDREMLKMIEFLRRMEMIQQMEMLRDMHHLEDTSEPEKTAPDKTAPAKKKETLK